MYRVLGSPQDKVTTAQDVIMEDTEEFALQRSKVIQVSEGI
jgi:hypothetical protein